MSLYSLIFDTSEPAPPPPRMPEKPDIMDYQRYLNHTNKVLANGRISGKDKKDLVFKTLSLSYKVIQTYAEQLQVCKEALDLQKIQERHVENLKMLENQKQLPSPLEKK